ncbi:DUF72 domain-containing protein [Luteipulveratus sp. YIM 133132]|uniref:DUF72 domain-containing protein n=1 Tax=Luteipulveratus flavus TaxID=3031728 RepID=UPI0023B015CC|nr:DUF72 domain-containing protein [Luteipulveratus sp. YIM 133132]MDE9364094.1 DUF72 domain-containing protein [Luteipulveratus sp. YIM 133132]
MVIRLGTSGWTYDDWAGRFYPREVKQRDRLEYYATLFDTVELNASFYRWPSDTTFTGWHDRLPARFAMTVKGPRSLTHARRLRDPERWNEIMTRSLGRLGDRCGPLLLQLPPDLERDDDRLDRVLTVLPRDLRVAVELRHTSWLADEVLALLERHAAAYVVMSGAGLQQELRVTAPFVYVRWHGPDPDHLYRGSYDDAALEEWAGHIRSWTRDGRDVYGYFNNDQRAYAPTNALRLKEMLGQG